MPMNNPLIGITVYGMDRPGIIAGISEVLAMNSINIVDIEQHVLQGLFFMFIVADTTDSNIAVDRLTALLKKKGKEIGVEVRVVPFRHSERAKNELYVMTVLGKDRVGIVFEISNILYQHGINIEKTSLKARDDLISIEWLLDLKEHDVNQVKRFLRSKIEEFGLDVVIQPESIFKRKKRLIVFDMDSTIVENEIINEIAKEAGVIEEVRKLTYEAMNGNVDFERALKNRVSLLKGLPVEVLEKIANEIKLTPGAKELIRSLKSAGYKTALVSGGFTYFTNRLKEELGFDYAFGNELEIKDGKLTGRIKGTVINAEVKAKIIEDLAKKEGVSKEDVVAVGDGANDTLMIKNAGLGVAFNAKKVLKEVSDGSISKTNLIGLASVLNLPSEFYRRIGDR